MRRLFWVLVGAMVAGALVVITFSDEGLFGLYRLKQKQARLELELTRLQAENQQLRQEIERLKHDPAYWEKIAREKLGLVQPDEIVFQFNPAPPTSFPAR